MDKISIFNYEAFYLDFLEGNLNDEDTALLLSFLEQHPELKIEEDALPVLDPDLPMLDQQFKSDLKQISFNETAVSADNVEQFMIAQTEGLLTKEKISELDGFIGENASLRKTKALYAATKIKPDLSVVFTDKDSLRKNRRMAIWPYVAFAAAASVVAFFFIVLQNGNRSLTDPIGNEIAQTDSLNQKKLNKKELKNPSNNSVEQNSPVDEVFIPGKTFAENRDIESAPSIVSQPDQRKDARPIIDPIKLKSPRTIELAHNESEIIENRSSYVTEQQMEKTTNDYAQLGFQEMKNPIKPVTNRLGDLVNQEVDFRTAKASPKNSGGFYVKIGKFEISHKKH